MSAGRLVVLVDGSNVTHRVARATSIDIADSQRLFVDQVCSWGAALGHDVIITFDGAGPYGAGDRQVTPEVAVVGTGARDADGVLEHRSRGLRKAGRRVWLVTDDVALRRVAGAGADRITSGSDFLELLQLDERQNRQAATERPVSAAPPRDTRVTDGLDPATWAKLERLRRGDT
ncbi:MAG: NYN domain-containing protein [Thermoleophilia bacterium]|nr:NYN domain-containing protein [Thermoleophilia bacterium]